MQNTKVQKSKLVDYSDMERQIKLEQRDNTLRKLDRDYRQWLITNGYLVPAKSRFS